MKSKISLSFLAHFFLVYTLTAQPSSITVGTGFGYENKIIEAIENDFFIGLNREIVYVNAVEIGVGISVSKNLEVGTDFSYTRAILNSVGQFNGQKMIEYVGWTSIGGWGKYILLPHKRLQFAIQASVGVHIGYPKRMNVDTIERHVAFYAGFRATV